MKRHYMKPAMQVVLLQHQTPLLVNSVNNNDGLRWGDITPDEDDV